MNGKLCFTNLFSFYIELTSMVDKERAVDVYVKFLKYFDMSFHDILKDKVIKYRIDSG